MIDPMEIHEAPHTLEQPEHPDEEWSRLEDMAPPGHTSDSWQPETLEDMAWLAERAAWHARKLAEQEAASAARIERERNWITQQRERAQQRLSWYEGHAIAFLQRHRQQELDAGISPERLTKTLSLPGNVGKLTARQGRDKFDVLDEPQAIKWAETHDRRDLLNIKTNVDKRALAALLKETGEIPDGVELIPGEVTFRLELPK